jgi:hypothetical protein
MWGNYHILPLSMATIIHYFLHLVFPFFIAVLFFKKEWKFAYLLLLATMLIDMDHLLATPVFEANRCSINFHPLHTYWALMFYVVLLFLRKPYRILGIGFILHLITDFIDCLFTYHNCKECLAIAPALPLIELVNSWFDL